MRAGSPGLPGSRGGDGDMSPTPVAHTGTLRGRCRAAARCLLSSPLPHAPYAAPAPALAELLPWAILGQTRFAAREEGWGGGTAAPAACFGGDIACSPLQGAVPPRCTHGCSPAPWAESGAKEVGAEQQAGGGGWAAGGDTGACPAVCPLGSLRATPPQQPATITIPRGKAKPAGRGMASQQWGSSDGDVT